MNMKPPISSAIIAVTLALFSGVSVAGVKNVAVVETEIDARSGASAELTSAEVTVITTELRREAVKNLPRDKYNIMTTETVIAQGSAFAVDCNEENCVIALGSKIGADYIVRGTITKFQALFILSVEIYETEDGNLVALSDPVRSENIGGLLEKAAPVCAEMYKTFVREQSSVQKHDPKHELEPEAKPEPKQPVAYTVTINTNPVRGGVASRNPNQTKYTPGTHVNVTARPSAGYIFAGWSGAAEGEENPVSIVVDNNLTLTANFKRQPKPKPEPKPKPPREPIQWAPIKLSAGGGALFAGGFGGGLKFRNGEQTAMPYYGGGVSLFFDATYVEASIGFSTGGGKWKSADASAADTLPDMSRSYISIGAFAKYPVAAGNIKIFPLLGFDYEASISGKLKYADGVEYPFDGNGYDGGALSALWFKFGGGFDADLNQNMYIRAEILYGFRTANAFEKDEATLENAKTRPGSGLTLRVGVGVRF